MREEFTIWLRLLAIAILMFIVAIVIGAAIFCRPYFPICLEPMIAGVFIAGAIAFVLSIAVFLVMQLIRKKHPK